MDYKLTLFLLLMSAFEHKKELAAIQAGICSKTIQGVPECCRNYRMIGLRCEECWPGTYGVDCKEDCPLGYYGRFCVNRCWCAACNKVTGCSITSPNGSEEPKILHTTERMNLTDTAQNVKEKMGRSSNPRFEMKTSPFTDEDKLNDIENISFTNIYEGNESNEESWTAIDKGNENEHKIASQTILSTEEKGGSSTFVVTSYNPKTYERNGPKWWTFFIAMGFILPGISVGCIFSKKCSVLRQPSIYFHSASVYERSYLEKSSFDKEEIKERGQQVPDSEHSASSTLNIYDEISDCIEEYSLPIKVNED